MVNVSDIVDELGDLVTAHGAGHTRAEVIDLMKIKETRDLKDKMGVLIASLR